MRKAVTSISLAILLGIIVAIIFALTMILVPSQIEPKVVIYNSATKLSKIIYGLCHDTPIGKNLARCDSTCLTQIRIPRGYGIAREDKFKGAKCPDKCICWGVQEDKAMSCLGCLKTDCEVEIKSIKSDDWLKVKPESKGNGCKIKLELTKSGDKIIIKEIEREKY